MYGWICYWYDCISFCYEDQGEKHLTSHWYDFIMSRYEGQWGKHVTFHIASKRVLGLVYML